MTNPLPSSSPTPLFPLRAVRPPLLLNPAPSSSFPAPVLTTADLADLSSRLAISLHSPSLLLPLSLFAAYPSLCLCSRKSRHGRPQQAADDTRDATGVAPRRASDQTEQQGRPVAPPSFLVFLPYPLPHLCLPSLCLVQENAMDAELAKPRRQGPPPALPRPAPPRIRFSPPPPHGLLHRRFLSWASSPTLEVQQGGRCHVLDPVGSGASRRHPAPRAVIPDRA